MRSGLGMTFCAAAAALLAACGGGGGGSDTVEPVVAEILAVDSNIELGKAFLASGRLESRPVALASAQWKVTKLTAGAPDMAVDNGDCAVADKKSKTVNLTTLSTWTCDAVLTAPGALSAASTYRVAISGVDENGNASSAHQDITLQPGGGTAPVGAPIVETQDAVAVLAGDDVGLNCLATGGSLAADSAYRFQWVLKENVGALPVSYDADADGALSFKAPAVRSATEIVFQCRVTDDNLATGMSQTTVTINQGSVASAVASAGWAQVTAPGVQVTLDGTMSASPSGAPLYYSWSQTEGPSVTLAGATSARPSFYAPSVTEHARLVFRLVAQTVYGATASAAPSEIAEVAVYVDPIPLTLTTSAAQRVASNAPVTMTVSVAPAGTIYYEWTQVAGPTVKIGGANTASAGFVAPAPAAGTEMIFSVKAARKPIALAQPSEIASTDVVVFVEP